MLIQVIVLWILCWISTSSSFIPNRKPEPTRATCAPLGFLNHWGVLSGSETEHVIRRYKQRCRELGYTPRLHAR